MLAGMSETDEAPADLFAEMLRIQGEAARQMMATVMPEEGDAALGEWSGPPLNAAS